MAVSDMLDKLNIGNNITIKNMKKNIDEKAKEKAKIFGFIGMEVYGLHTEGKIKIPELNIYFEKLSVIEEEISELLAEKQRMESKNAGGGICSCGCQLTAENRFCPKCGKAVENGTIVCAGCGRQFKSDMQFCSYCGYSLQETKSLSDDNFPLPSKECICGAKVLADQFMCMECGRKLEN